MAITVRIAQPADATRIATIQVRTWRVAYRGQMPDAVLDALDVGRRAEIWKGRLAASDGGTFIAESNGQVIGFCDLMASRDPDANPALVGEIAALYVLPDHWRTGAGRALCTAAFDAAARHGYSQVTLWVLSSNARARCFYAAMGFASDGAAKVEKKYGHELHEVRYRLVLALTPE